MRTYGALSPIDQIETPPDTVHTLLLPDSVAQASDWANSTVGAADAGAHIARFTGMRINGLTRMHFMVNLVSTHAAVPSSGSSVTTGTTINSTGNNLPVFGSRTLQIPSWSTGFSVATLSSGYVQVEVWRK